jgi:putative DeoR family transcriptional regulator (stage III sporulation protein D)
VSERLKHINPSLYREVALVLEQNKQERHMRGGEATRQKYIQQRTHLNTEEKERNI